ncbi:MAG: hypothetical protein IPM63_09975 [Acidobacteriota bacterium]|nr:MAG: hypothetical protein IPM63_09975 [Acidobacteriota bacterium]
MQKPVISFAAFLVGVSVGVVASQLSALSPSSRPVETEEPDLEIPAAINEFWDASLESDEAKLNRTTTDVPDDYYEMIRRCSNSSASSATNDDSPPFPFSVNDSKIDFEREQIRIVFQKIARGQLSFFRLLKTIKTEKYAYAFVHYGKPSNPVYDSSFLLVNRLGKWQLFMITSRPMEEENGMYTAESCEDKIDYQVTVPPLSKLK